MIWQNAIHSRRTIDEWIGDPDCGFPAVLLQLLSKPHGNVPTVAPARYVELRPVIFVASDNEIGKLIPLLEHFAAYTDSAFWINCRGIKNVTRQFTTSSWLDMSFRDSYVSCDILIVGDIPGLSSQDTNDPYYQDCMEINAILRDRLSRKGKLTIIIGANHDQLPALVQYKALKKIQEGYQ
jgi:hypothetical protein